MPDLESVISSSIEGATAGDTGGTETVDNSTDVATDAGGAEGVTEPVADPAADAAAAPVDGAQPVKKRGPIPYDRHEAVLTKARREHEAAVAALNERLQRLSWAEAEDAQAKIQALDLAESNPRLFAEIALNDGKLGPVFRELLQAAAAPQQPVQKQAADEKPQPDLLYENGTTAYSAEQMEKLLQWQQSQFEQRLNGMLEDRLKPVNELRERQVLEHEWNSALQRQGAVLSDARQNWPKFTEHESAIREHLRANPKDTLESAYRKVVLPRLQADRDAQRAEILKELNEKPGAAIKAPNTAAQAAGGSQSLEDVIMRRVQALQ